MAFLFAAAGSTQVGKSAPASTRDHVAAERWWPTKRPEPQDAFVGDPSCAACHAGILSTQANSAMGRAAFHGAGTPQAGVPAQDTLHSGTFSYRFVHQGSGYALEVRQGDDSLSSAIRWTFGAGQHGQSYLLQEGDSLYEAQVSSFATGHIGLTPGHAETTEGSLQFALGNRLSSSEAARCFSCHTTAWSSAGETRLTAAVPGVHCEACHGPGKAHVEAVHGHQLDAATAAVLNPADLNPVDSVDFCGACHRASMDVLLTGAPGGLSSLRFQPYRLEKSRCWNATEDARLTCVACHNPHAPLVHDASSYDVKCLACHSASVQAAHHTVVSASGNAPLVCPRAKSNCTTCHMPKYVVPEMHSQFTDHFIRVVRPGEAFPN